MNYDAFFSYLSSKIDIVAPHLYEENTLGIERKVKGVLRPRTIEEIKICLQAARENQIRLQPLSTGKNWGYGSALSADPEAVILELSHFKKISFNSIDETFSIEPGVTQGELFQFLEQNKLDYLVPTTGAGPNVSVLANALERGYGVTPYEEHFDAILSMKVILADGSQYEPVMAEKTGHGIWRWDTGPYLQGLFSQSCLGIVVEITIRLYQKPSRIGMFKAESFDLSSLIQAAKEARKLEVIKGIKLFNGLRISSMTGAVKDPNLWTLIGSFYCQKELLSGTKKAIKRIFSSKGLSVKTMDNVSFKYLGPFLKRFDSKQYGLVRSALDAINGKPICLDLNLMNGEENINKSGLIWYSPIIPNDPAMIEATTNMVVEVCQKHSILPLIAYTLVNPNVFDAIIPIRFSKEQNAKEAWACYDTLVKKGIEMGIMPYRYPVNRMNVFSNSSANRLHKIIKKALDPHNILAGGRYVSED